MKTIKIDVEIDFIILGIYEDGVRSIIARWKNEFSDTGWQESALNKAKIEAFTLLWQLKELGNVCELNPYTN